MEGARLPFVIDPPPIENAIRRIAVFLDLDEEIAATDGVQAPARDEKAVAGFDRQPWHQFGYFAVVDRLFELRRLHPRPQPGENLRTIVSGGEIPELALWFPAKGRRDLRAGMDLQ
jgi:hypothetical protein